MNRRLIIKLSGKADQVFQLFALLAKERGNDTLGQIIKGG